MVAARRRAGAAALVALALAAAAAGARPAAGPATPLQREVVDGDGGDQVREVWAARAAALRARARHRGPPPAPTLSRPRTALVA
jgi:hypothetical protein